MKRSHWTKGRIRDLIVSLNGGISVNSEDRPAEKGEYGILKTSAVTEGVFRPKENKVIPPEELPRARLNPKKDSILISRMNTPALVGASAYIEKEYPNLFLPDRLWQFEAKSDQICMRWLAYVLGSSLYRNRLTNIASGTSGSMKNISKPSVLSLEISIPPFTEQKAIAEALTIWDRAIDLTERLIATKQKLCKGLMQQSLMEKRRLHGFTSPWRTVRLRKIFYNRKESNRGDLPLLAITKDRGVIPRDEVERKDSSNADKSRYLRICPGDIGYNTMRMWQGVSALSGLEGIVSPAYTIVTPKDEVDGEFMALFFKFPPTINLFFRYSQGLVADTLNLKFNNFAKIQVTIPEKTEQQAIKKIFRKLDKEISLLGQVLDALKVQKKGLMQQLLTS